MSRNEEVKEIVTLAKERSASIFEEFMEAGEIPEDPASTARIIEGKKWLAENCELILVNQPGSRERWGYSAESIAKMSKAIYGR